MNFIEFGGAIDSWCVIRHERESQIILANQDGIHQLHHSYQTPLSLPLVSMA